jgi:hypothetical protein
MSKSKITAVCADGAHDDCTGTVSIGYSLQEGGIHDEVCTCECHCTCHGQGICTFCFIMASLDEEVSV